MDKTTLTIAIIALLLSIGIPVHDRTIGSVLEDELKDYYICSVDETILEFKGGTSGTDYTGYPYLESRKGYKRCGTSDNKGKWISLDVYAELLGVDPYTLLEEQKEEIKSKEIPSPIIGHKRWLCNIEKCVSIG